MICSNCGTQINEGEKFCSKCGTPASAPVTGTVTTEQGVNFDFTSNTVSAQTPKKYEYKVLSQKDKWFSGKFDPASLEKAMNAYAEQGWRVIGCATADIPGFGGPRQEFVTILERER